MLVPGEKDSVSEGSNHSDAFISMMRNKNMVNNFIILVYWTDQRFSWGYGRPGIVCQVMVHNMGKMFSLCYKSYWSIGVIGGLVGVNFSKKLTLKDF